MSGGESPSRGHNLATLLIGDRYQGDSKWPKKWWDTTLSQAKDPDAHLEGDDYLKAKQDRAAHWMKDLDPDKFMEEVRGTEEKPITNNDGKEKEQAIEGTEGGPQGVQG
jgi:hypothetical protein